MITGGCSGRAVSAGRHRLLAHSPTSQTNFSQLPGNLNRVPAVHRFIRLAVLVVAGVIAAVLAMADFGLIANAGAHPAPAPTYYWCPGQPFDPAWGPNWDPTTCHDDVHRDVDGADHSRDFVPGDLPVDEQPWLDEPAPPAPPAAGGGGA